MFVILSAAKNLLGLIENPTNAAPHLSMEKISLSSLFTIPKRFLVKPKNTVLLRMTGFEPVQVKQSLVRIGIIRQAEFEKHQCESEC